MSKFLGWINNPIAVTQLCREVQFKSVAEYLESLNLTSLLQAGNTDPILLYEIFRKLGKGDIQCGPQQIGDCVSWGWGGEVDNAQAAAIVVGNQPWEFQESATEYIYGASRVEIGGQRGSYEDGSVGAWAAKAVSRLGWLSRKYLESKIGSGAYSGKRASEWGAKGVPDDLEPEGKLHLFKDVVQVKTFDEAVAMIRLLKGIPICSGQSFSQTRDSDGFCSPTNEGWEHCMRAGGFRLDRPGLLLHQNWGRSSPKGPKYRDQPDNTFFVDKAVINTMLARKDSFSPTGTVGYTIEQALDFYKF